MLTGAGKFASRYPWGAIASEIVMFSSDTDCIRLHKENLLAKNYDLVKPKKSHFRNWQARMAERFILGE